VSPEWLLFGNQVKKSPARMVRAGDQTPDTGSYPVEDNTILLGVAA